MTKTFVVAPNHAIAKLYANQVSKRIPQDLKYVRSLNDLEGQGKDAEVIIIEGDLDGHMQKRRTLHYSPEQMWMIIDIMKRAGLGWLHVKWVLI